MVGLVVVAVLGFCALVVVGTLVAAASLVGWILFLPFKLLGLLLRGLGLVLALPFILLAGVLGFLVFGAGVLALVLPALPFVLVALGIVWLIRHNARSVHSH